MKKNNTGLMLTCTLLLGGLTPICDAAIVSIGNMNITGGSYEVTENSGALIVNPDFGSTTTPLTFFGTNTNLVNGYIGTNSGTNVVAATTWFGLDVSVYTAPSNIGDTNTPAGSIAGSLVPTGLLDDVAGTIEMDLTAWFANWGGFDVYQGSANASGTWDSITGDYTLSWNSIVAPAACGPFGPSCEARWTLQGNASVVPVPGAFWLFGSGLIGLIGLARKRRE